MDQVRFDGMVAIVTGAGRGIGREHALLLGSRGASVVINDLGGSVEGIGADAQPAKSVAEEIRQAGGTAIANTDSVADRKGAFSIVKSAIDHFGKVDILINNAGIQYIAPFEGYPEDLLDRHFNVHFKGSWNMAQEVWPHMKRQGCGRILMTVSTTGFFGMADNAAYLCAKGALISLTRALALEGAAHGIQVNSLAPGADSRMVGQVTDPKLLAIVKKLKPSLVAPGACWLVHRDCPVTGRHFKCSAGRMSSIFVASSKGFRTDPDTFTLEAIRDNWDRVTALEPFHVPISVADDR